MKENYTHLLHVSLRKIEHPLSPPRNVNERARTRLPEFCIQIISLSSETYHHHTTSNQITSNIPQRSSKNQFPIRFQPLGFAIRTKVQPSNPKPQTPLLRPLPFSKFTSLRKQLPTAPLHQNAAFRNPKPKLRSRFCFSENGR